MNSEKILLLANGDLVKSMSGRYLNSLMLNGFILQKPKFINNTKKGIEACSFILHQINLTESGQVLDKTYSIMVYIPKVVEQMKTITTCCFVTCACNLEWNGIRKLAYGQAYDIEISCVLSDELDEPYNKDTFYKGIKK